MRSFGIISLWPQDSLCGGRWKLIRRYRDGKVEKKRSSKGIMDETHLLKALLFALYLFEGRHCLRSNREEPPSRVNNC